MKGNCVNYSNKTNNILMMLVITLFSSTFALNFCSKISQCALVFSIIIVAANILAELYSRKIALVATLASATISLLMLWNFEYKINGSVTDNVVLVSLLSIFISVFIGTNALKSHINLSFYQRNILSFIACAFVDGVVMSGFFINKFSNAKILTNFSKEIFFKLAYFSIICTVIYVISNISQNTKKKSNSIIT